MVEEMVIGGVHNFPSIAEARRKVVLTSRVICAYIML